MIRYSIGEFGGKNRGVYPSKSPICTMVPKRSDSTPSVTQSQFDRLAGANRDDWRKWARRGLVKKPRGGYAWPQVVEAIALVAIEEAVGIDGAVHCWDDIHEDLLSQIRSPLLDLVIDPGISEASRPRMRAFLSTSDAKTAGLVRAARCPHVVPLAEILAEAREEFERIVRLAQAHADQGTSAEENLDSAHLEAG